MSRELKSSSRSRSGVNGLLSSRRGILGDAVVIWIEVGLVYSYELSSDGGGCEGGGGVRQVGGVGLVESL